MKRLLLHFYIFFLIVGCASPRYGYTLEDWNNLTAQQREDVKAEASKNLIETRAKQREKEFVDHPIDVIFGTRSNTF